MPHTDGARDDAAARVAKDARDLLATTCGNAYADELLTIERRDGGLTISLVVFRLEEGEVLQFQPGGWAEHLRMLNYNAFAVAEEERKPAPEVGWQ